MMVQKGRKYPGKSRSWPSRNFSSTCKWEDWRFALTKHDLGFDCRESLNQARLMNEKKGNYLTAEVSLA